ncbi:hypothetical protein RI129_009146 [Pyrocoelia pectoralis]|uniref:THUMP domain-containing protein n=1 Tax=Pyrocoelia pectoralis TaxID=417401 RepID=A0AAN7VGK2_9COLE
MAEIKKRKNQYFDYGQKRKRSALQPGLKGFFCSCNVREKDCISESYNILNEYADQLELVGSEEKANTEVDGIGDMDRLQEEIQALQSLNRHRSNKFQVLESGAKNIVFIRTMLEDPVKLAHSIIEDIFKNKQQKTRFLIRLVPIEITCKAYLDDIKHAVEPLIHKYFGNEPKTFSICYNHRNNNNLSRDDVICAVADIVIKNNSAHKVDLKSAELSIVIEVIKNCALLSVVPDFLRYKKYNLHAICKNDEETESK